MILYVSSKEHTNLLDFLDWDKEGNECTIKKLVGDFMLKQFVLYDMRNFSHCTEIVLDRIAFGDTDEEFAEAIWEFRMMYHARVTVICEGLKTDVSLFTELLNCGVVNIIRGTGIEEIRAEIRECFSSKGMQRYQVKRIALLSVMQRIGVTTAAIGMTSWLARAGRRVHYVEANDRGHLAYIARVYQMEKKENGYYADNAGFYLNEVADGADFVIYDLGDSFWKRKDVVDNADTLVLVCGTKPYELAETIRFLKEFETREAFVLCPFVNKSDRDNIDRAFTTEYHQVLFSEYQPDLFDGSVNERQFKRIINDNSSGV